MNDARVARLLEVAGRASEVLILPHNDPDPDAIASAVALKALLEGQLPVRVTIGYHGIIARAENRALVSYLGEPLFRLAASAVAEPDAIIALVDTQPGAGNNPLSPHTLPDIVIDHHPWREATASVPYADVRANVGATATILVEYLTSSGTAITPRLATALFYGIKTDTFSLGRSASQADVEAYFRLQPLLEAEQLFHIEYARLPAEYYDHLHAALEAVRIYDNVAVAYLGPLAYPDLAAEIADLLLRLEDVDWVICLGQYDETVLMSVRCWQRTTNAGQMVQAVVGTRGIAGGHGAMAAGHIPLGTRTAAAVAEEIIQHSLRYLNVSPEIVARPLIGVAAAKCP
jgi:nanoRNase/pAp phosphatase (c-di-AMP/oligoRNAs hydrolase)